MRFSEEMSSSISMEPRPLPSPLTSGVTVRLTERTSACRRSSASITSSVWRVWSTRSSFSSNQALDEPNRSVAVCPSTWGDVNCRMRKPAALQVTTRRSVSSVSTPLDIDCSTLSL